LGYLTGRISPLQRIVFRFLVALSIALGLLSCSGDTSTGRNSGAVLQKDGTEDQNVGGTSASSSSATTAPASSAAAPAAGATSSYEAYVNSYLDLNLAYNQYAAAGGKMTKDQWGRQHYTVAGQKEGRIVPAASPTVTTTAPTTVSYTAYVDSYPDLKAAYRTYVSNGGILSQSDWGKQHYTNAGQKEGRRLTGSVATSVASSSGGSGGSGDNKLGMKATDVKNTLANLSTTYDQFPEYKDSLPQAVIGNIEKQIIKMIKDDMDDGMSRDQAFVNNARGIISQGVVNISTGLMSDVKAPRFFVDYFKRSNASKGQIKKQFIIFGYNDDEAEAIANFIKPSN